MNSTKSLVNQMYSFDILLLKEKGKSIKHILIKNNQQATSLEFTRKIFFIVLMYSNFFEWTFCQFPFFLSILLLQSKQMFRVIMSNPLWQGFITWSLLPVAQRWAAGICKLYAKLYMHVSLLFLIISDIIYSFYYNLKIVCFNNVK